MRPKSVLWLSAAVAAACLLLFALLSRVVFDDAAMRRSDCTLCGPVKIASPQKAAVLPPDESKPVAPTGDALLDFDAWSRRYLQAGADQRAALNEEGVRLARERRPIFKQLIKDDPRGAIEQAVSMVVRQNLPLEIVSLLERRLNHRAAVTVYQGSLPPDAPPLPPGQTITHRIAQVPGEGAYNLHVYGRRAESVLNVPNAAINGVGIDREIAANEEPLRVLEVGEVPDQSKKQVTVCPISGLTTANEEQVSQPVNAAQAETVVETPEEVIYLCGGYHRPMLATQLVFGEGSTGGPTAITGVLPAPPTPAIGMCRVLYIPMTFQDQNNAPATESKCYDVMRDVADYYSKSSFGKLTTLTIVTPPIRLPKNEAWYIQRDTSNGGDVDGLGLQMAHSREEAKRLGFNYEDYDVTVLRMSGGARPAGGWGGGSTVWIYGDSVGVTAHEIGHAFGLAHANYWDTAGTSAIGPGANQEYGDQYDVMGGGSVPKDHYNVAAKVQVKWLPGNFVQDVTASGLYRLHAFDQQVLDPSNRYALTVTKDSQHTYWGELRQNYTGDATRPWVDKGMLLGWKYSSGGGGNVQLIDTTPGSPFAKDDAPIALGQTFDDTEAGIYMTTVGVSSTTPKYVDVVVNIGDFSGNHAPTLTLATSADNVPTAATVTFTATASDVDGDTLAYQWQHWGDTGTRLVSPNSSVITRTFSTAGTYVVSCTVSDMKGGTVTRSKLITVGNGGGKFTINGRVTAGGIGLPGVLLNANATNPVITDSDGYYTIANLTANTYTVTPLLYGYTFSELFNNSITVGPNFSGANFEAEALPSVSIAALDATATENSGSDTATFLLTRTGDMTQSLTVNVNPATGSAAAGDYTLNPALAAGSGGFSTFTIPADSATLNVIVTTSSDTTAEGPETLKFALGAGSGYLVAPNAGVATITIEDDDTTLPKISIAATSNTTLEGLSTPGVFTITRSGAPASALAVNYVVSGSATSGSDFTALSGTHTFAIGASSGTINVTPLNDAIVESLETVIVTTSTNAAYLINPSAASSTVNIIDDDTNVITVAATDATAQEIDLSIGGAVADTGTFVITRTGDTTLPLTVYYSVAGNPSTGVPALNGVDYEALPGVVQIPAGAAAASVTIMPRWDAFGETPEQVLLQLGAGPTDYKIGSTTSATVTINDSATSNAPYVEVIGLTSATEGSTAGKFRFSLKGSIAGTISVPFSIGGTAAVTTDYTVALPVTTPVSTFDTATGNGVLVMTSTGSVANVLDVTINTVNDTDLEDLETVTCTLTPNAAFTSFNPTSSASIWLRDNDQPTVWADSQISTGSSNRVTEGSATSPIKFYVSRTGSTTNALTVNFALQGNAIAGTDYTVTTSATLTFDNVTSTGVLTIPSAAQGANVLLSISTTNDSTFEGTETIVFRANAGSYSRTPDAVIYLDDNDTSTLKVAFDTTGASGSESATSVNVPVSLTNPAPGPVTVDYVVDSGSRSSASATTTKPTLPYWVRVVRAGTALSSYFSTDGVIWRQVGTTQTISMSSTSYTAGLIAASATTSATCTATIDSLSITDLDGGGTAGAASHVTIGTTTPASSSSEAGGVYTITAGGNDLAQSGTGGDVGRYVSFPITNSANCTITARVVSITGGSATAARGGVMIRESTATTSRHMTMTGQIEGTGRMVHRITTSAATVTSTFLRPYWVKLQRAGDVFSAFASPDGSLWTQTGTGQTIQMSPDVVAGLAVSARSDGTLTTAVFDNVSLNGSPSPALVGRTIGYVNAQGSDSVSSGVYTVNGSGAQVGGTEDECHFVAAPVTGDFTLIARVISQSGGATNAQAGVMARETYNYRARSTYIGLPANSMSEFIYRNSTTTNAFGSSVDHTLASGTLSFVATDQTKNISFNVINDTIPEPNEAITILLRNPNGAQLNTNTTFTYVIDDNDAQPALPSLGFAAASSNAAEASGTVNLDVSLSATAASSITVDYAVTGGTATAGTDFTLASGTLTFAAGELVKPIPLVLIDDNSIDAAETIILTLTNPVGANLDTLSTHTFTINDDDLPVVTITANDPDAAEAGLDPGQFTVTRTGPTTSSLMVNFSIATGAGRATSVTDFTSVGTSISIPIGASAAVINVVPLNDTSNEGPETVQVTLGSNAAYALGAAVVATVTIADDDRSIVTIAATDAIASETAGNTGTFTITRTAPTTGSQTVTYSVSGTAVSGSDFTSVGTSVAFTAGQTSKTITVSSIEDSTTEGDETVVVQLSAGTYTIGGNGYDTVTIQDNDNPPTVFITGPTSNGALVASGNGIVVSATVADDGAPAPVAVQWSQASGPGIATFEAPTQTTSPVTFSADGVYVLRITVTDTQFTVSDQVTVIVGSTIAAAEWIAQDMGPTTQQRGQSAKSGSSYVLTGMGAGYAAVTTDTAHVMARQVTGDGSIIARLTALSGAAASPLAGVTIRDSLARASNRAVLGYNAGSLQFRTRTAVSTNDTVVSQGGITLPVWVKLERVSTSNAISASYATDNAGVPGTWNAIGTATTITMVNDITQMGLTATGNSNTAGQLCAATFDNVTLTLAPSGPALVTEDFGVATPTASTFAFNGTTYTIGGSGGMDGSGAFYGWQYQGDVMVTAKLASATSTALSAKSGIMIRESMDSTAGYIHIGRIPQGAFSGYIWRSLANGGGGGVPSFTGAVRWMRLIRQGNRVTAYHAADSGGNPGTWTQLGQPQTIIMSTPVMVGFAVDNAGGTAGVLNNCTFTNLSIVPLNKAPVVGIANVATYPLSPVPLDGTVTDDNFPTPISLTTQWTQRSGPGTITFGNAALVDTIASISLGGSYSVRLQADDSSAITFRDLAFNAYLTPFQAWQAQNWSPNLGDPNAAEMLDPDFDGQINLLEYAFGTTPGLSDASPLTFTTANVSGSNYMRLIVPKNPDATDVTFTVEATGNLANPLSWSSAGLVIELNNSTTLQVRDNVPAGPGVQRFMRVRVERP